MADFEYTDRVDVADSSVIDTIFYNSEDKELVVELKSGTLCGYSDVPADVFKAFGDQEKLGASAGKYWNDWIRPHFTGFSTSYILDIEPLEAEDNMDFPKLRELMQNVSGIFDFAAPAVEVEDVTKAEEVELVAQAPVATEELSATEQAFVNAERNENEIRKNEYLIAFEYTAKGEAYEAELAVYAPTYEIALSNFNRLTALAGYDEVTPKSITIYFA